MSISRTAASHVCDCLMCRCMTDFAASRKSFNLCRCSRHIREASSGCLVRVINDDSVPEVCIQLFAMLPSS